MPLVDIMDDTFVAATPAMVAARIRDPALWRTWWPRLALTVREDRDIEGIRWQVSGHLVGTAEVWIEEYEQKGSFVHFFLRADPVTAWRFRRRVRAQRLTSRYRMAWKRRIHELKDVLESDAAGSPASTVLLRAQHAASANGPRRPS